MTGSDASTNTLLSDKLSLVTHHHLLTRVPMKLDLDDWNYGSWEYFFEQLCASYEVTKFIRDDSTVTASSTVTPPTPDEVKVDKIVLSWIFTTLSDPLQKRLVIARPATAKAAWTLILDIVKDNKKTRTSALKTELRSIKLGNMSMEAYFQKIDSLVTTLTSLGSVVNEEDVVQYAVAGVPAKYNQVCGYMHYQPTFPDLKTVRSLLITEEMRLKTEADTLLMDSSSPMALVTESGNSRQPSSTPQFKPWRPCYHFAKGTCRFGDGCRFLHDTSVKNTNTNGLDKKNSNTNDILVSLLTRLGLKNYITKVTDARPTSTTHTPPGFRPTAYYTHACPTPYYSNPNGIPPGFGLHGSSTIQQPYYGYPLPTPTQQPAHAQHAAPPLTGLIQQPPARPTTIPAGNLGPTMVPEQPTNIPNAFTTGTLFDPTTGAWNMDTGLHDSSGSTPM